MKNKIKSIDILAVLSKIKPEICQFIDSKMNDFESLEISTKVDRTPVTIIDLKISKIFKEAFKSEFPFLNFYSEEDPDNLTFPCVILDPIDGTKELAQGLDECAISFGVYFSGDLANSENFSWIFNPFNRFKAHSAQNFINSRKKKRTSLYGLVSNTEFEADMYSNSAENIIVMPKGSIAYKLALLSQGVCDFVMTKKPKNIWDIMAGSHLCHRKGIKLFQGDKEITILEDALIEAPLIWCKKEDFHKIKRLVQN
jgi:myo-inositol-1(or 4)-monophosphatase